MKPENVTAWSAALQALAAVASLVVAVVLVWVTHRYTKLTKEILGETVRARQANEDSALAAHQSAEAAQKSIDLALQQFAEQRGQAPHIVMSCIRQMQAQIAYWEYTAAAARHAPQRSLSATIDKQSLVRAAECARQFSIDCASLIALATANLTNAESELKKHPSSLGNLASSYLGSASKQLTEALKIAAQQVPAEPQPSPPVGGAPG
jgi:hypothetical protein